MKHRSILITLSAVILLSLLTVSGSQAQEPAGDINAQALGTAFTYQGRLTDGGSVANGEYDFLFELYSGNDGSGLGRPVSKENVFVTEGTFTVELDFGDVFDGTPLLLGIGVRPGNSSGAYTTLSPQQWLTPAPYAHYATHAPWNGLSGVPAGLRDGDDNTTYTAGTGLTLSGGAFSLVAGYRLPQGCNNGQMAEWNGSAWVCGNNMGGDITAVNAGTGLTGGGTSGEVTLYANASYLQRRVSSSCSTGSAIRVINANGTVTCQTTSGGAAHDHWGETWSGSGTGLSLNSSTGIGVRGTSTDSYGTGVYGEGVVGVEGSGVTGVSGSSWSSSGTGVYGEGGTGVEGKCIGDSGCVGIFGQGGLSRGIGVEGFGFTGIEGKSSSDYGRGVSGSNRHGSNGYGVYGLSESSSGGYGVFGLSSSSDDTGTGVYGQGSKGVHGRGGNKGVFGESYSGTGVSGYSSGSSGTGVSGEGHTGVSGRSTINSGIGVFGQSDSSGQATGVRGLSYSTSGRGVVGSASATSGNTYGVIGYNSSPDGHAGFFRNTSVGVALRAQSDGWGNIIEGWSGFSDRKFRVGWDGDVRADGSFLGGGADYAELLPGAAGLEPGEVLVISPEGELSRSTKSHQSSVAGVYSTQPGFVAGAGDDSVDVSGRIPLAVMGVVPVKATTENGHIQPGDLLTSSGTPGHAMQAGENPPVGTVIGKALEPLTTSSGVIKILVVLQ